MSVPIEAQSISALGNLLANPPQYPRNPTHEVREPLVLYILRVPGSKDVFLTPLKPPTKSSISLEAIQSSLYYLHVTSEEDEEVRRSIDAQRQSEETERTNPPIHRKPLPPTPYSNYPPIERPIPPPKSYPSYQPGLAGDIDSTQRERHAARGSHLRFINDSDTQNAQSKRHSLSPRRLQQNVDLEAYGQHHKSLYNRSTDNFRSPPSLSRQESYGSGSGSPTITERAPFSSSSLYTHSRVDSRDRAQYRRSNDASAITMIRRDPVSGSQWNVGSISIGTCNNPKESLSPTLIEITSPGYSRFATIPEFPRPGTGYSDADSIKEALAGGKFTSIDPSESDTGRHTFVRMADYQQQTAASRPFRFHQRTGSSGSGTHSTSPSKQPRQMYSFLSPWQGLCTFGTSIDGKSLRCRHSLSSSNFTEEDTTMNVAELRFNLPWSPLSNSGDKAPEDETIPISKLLGPRSGKEAFRRKLQNFRDNLHDRSSSYDDAPVSQEPTPRSRLEPDMDRLSLKLGREKAGGGLRGTSAKLGKLIIEDEGLKMCDLVVAACMGVWWQHYEERDD